jgi:hypothetical protein
MTTPLIDERALVAMLDCTPTYEVVQRLQQGALYTLIDASIATSRARRSLKPPLPPRL